MNGTAEAVPSRYNLALKAGVNAGLKPGAYITWHARSGAYINLAQT
jgi:hypothetical protein